MLSLIEGQTGWSCKVKASKIDTKQNKNNMDPYIIWLVKFLYVNEITMKLELGCFPNLSNIQ